MSSRPRFCRHAVWKLVRCCLETIVSLFVLGLSSTGNGESVSRIGAGSRELKLAVVEDSAERSGQGGLQLRECLVAVRRVQTIVSHDHEFIFVEPHPRVFFEQAACFECGFADCRQVLDGCESCWSFPIVNESWPA